MFGSIKPGANACAKIGIDSGVLAARPHKLTLMLFDAALLALTMAQIRMQANDIEKKGTAISRAILMIESGLRASLDKKAGGAIAANLDALYAYTDEQLLMANLKNPQEFLLEVHALLTDLRATWVALNPDPQTPGGSDKAAQAPIALQIPAAPKMRVYCALAPRSCGFAHA